MDDMASIEAPREPADTDELRFVIDDELSRIPESFRAAVVFCDLEGMSYEEMADVMGVPIGTVRSRIYRGRRALQQRLAAFHGAGKKA